MDPNETIHQPHQESPQAKLKVELLSQTISPADFLEEVKKLDQSTPGREHAFGNAELLEDPAVSKLFEDGDIASAYQSTLSLTYFHMGQIEAIAGSEKALQYFESALKADAKVKWENYTENKLYTEATIAYLNKDISGLEMAYSKMKDGVNKNIVGNLIKGLRSRGHVNYSEDYHG